MTPQQQRAGAIRAIVIGLVLVTAFAFFFVYPGHDPKPNDLPVLIVGSGPGVERATAALDGVEGFAVEPADDEDEARERILDREAYGAIVPDGRKLLVASAASKPVADLLAGLAERQGLHVEDVRKLDSGDPRGLTINLLTLASTVPAILGALLLGTFAPLLPGPARLLALAVFAILGALASVLVVHTGIGSIGGDFLSLWAVTALGLYAIAVTAAALMALLGPAGVGVSFMVLLMLGNPASGAGSAPELLPDPWAVGGQFLPTGAFATGLRNTAYFDGAAAAHWLTVLVAYAVVASAVVWMRGRPAGASVAEPDAPPARRSVDATL